MCATNYYQCKCISDEGEFPMKAFMTATMTAAALAAGGAYLPSAEAAGVFFADAPVVSPAVTASTAVPGTRPSIYIPGQITTPYIDRALTTDENMFFLAIEKADYNTMQLMLDKGVDINAYYRRKDTTPLGRAMHMNNRTTIQFLLERGADVCRMAQPFVQHEIERGGKFSRRIAQCDLAERVFAADAKIRQEADAALLCHRVADKAEIVADESGLLLRQGLGKPQAVRADGIQGEETPVGAGGMAQVITVRVKTVMYRAQAAGNEVVLCGANQAQRDIRLAPVQIAQLHLAVQGETDARLAAAKFREMWHQQSFGNQRWRADNHFAHRLHRLARDASQLLHIGGEAARVLVEAGAVFGQEIAFADAVKQAQPQRLLQSLDAARHGTVLYVQRFCGGGERFPLYQHGEMVDIVPVRLHGDGQNGRRRMMKPLSSASKPIFG